MNKIAVLVEDRYQGVYCGKVKEGSKNSVRSLRQRSIY